MRAEDARASLEVAATLLATGRGAEPAAEESQSEGDAHRLDQKADVGEAEERRDLADDLFHRQKIFALTRNAHRPISASDRLATKVMMM